jgi:phage tail sheath protein FI
VALAHLADRADIALLLAPDTLNRAVVQGAAAQQAIEDRLVAHAAERRDKLVLLALPQTVSSVNDPSVAGLPSSGFAACWHPWLTAAGPQPRTLPPTGHVAGIIVRTDMERGVHKAPANETVRGLTSAPLVPGFSTLEQAHFNEAGINLIRDFRAQRRGIRVWGARTRSADPEWRYIPVRRLTIMIEQSLARGLQWAVFEPNDEPLWARLRASAEGFLQTLWQGGAMVGDTPSRAFFVRCDRSTMTEADLAAGRAVLLVGVAAVKPAEFLIVRLALMTGDANA